MTRTQSILEPQRYQQIPLPGFPGAVCYFHPNSAHPAAAPGHWDTASLEAPDRAIVDGAVAWLTGTEGWEIWSSNDEYAHLYRRYQRGA